MALDGSVAVPAASLPALLLSRMSERQFQAHVIAMAEARGWMVYHTYDSRRSQKGFPDLVLIKGSRLIFWELKRENGRVRIEQSDWLSALNRCVFVESKLLRPSDMAWIEEALG